MIRRRREKERKKTFEIEMTSSSPLHHNQHDLYQSRFLSAPTFALNSQFLLFRLRFLSSAMIGPLSSVVKECLLRDLCSMNVPTCTIICSVHTYVRSIPTYRPPTLVFNVRRGRRRWIDEWGRGRPMMLVRYLDHLAS